MNVWIGQSNSVSERCFVEEGSFFVRYQCVRVFEQARITFYIRGAFLGRDAQKVF